MISFVYRYGRGISQKEQTSPQMHIVYINFKKRNVTFFFLSHSERKPYIRKHIWKKPICVIDTQSHECSLHLRCDISNSLFWQTFAINMEYASDLEFYSCVYFNHHRRKYIFFSCVCPKIAYFNFSASINIRRLFITMLNGLATDRTEFMMIICANMCQLRKLWTCMLANIISIWIVSSCMYIFKWA